MVENRAVSLVGEKFKMILARHRPEPSSAHAVGQLGKLSQAGPFWMTDVLQISSTNR